MGIRLKGQEVDVVIMKNGVDNRTLSEIRSFSAELKLNILEEGYLGQTTDQYDDIFLGVKGDMEVHISKADAFSLGFDIVDRARNRGRNPAANYQFNAKASFQFPDGTRVRLLFKDLYFEGIPINVGGRSEYVTLKLSWSCSEAERLS